MSNTQRTPQQAMADALKSGAVQAFADGKPIHVEYYGKSDWTPFDSNFPEFQSPKWGWRPAPEPKLRPWNPEEVPVGALTRSLSSVNARNPSRQIITGENGVMAFVCGSPVSLQQLLESREYSLDGGKTWLPCGVMEESK